jgi:hypothetical protein
MLRSGDARVGVRARAGLVAAMAGLVMATLALLHGCGGTQPVKPGDTVDPRTAVPETCVHEAWCDFTLAQPPLADTSTLPLWGPLGCGPVYLFHSGKTNGVGSLCLDTPDHRTSLHDNGKDGFAPAPGGCSQSPKVTRCLKVPEGMVFVIWKTKVLPPFCPSTCQDISDPSAF